MRDTKLKLLVLCSLLVSASAAGVTHLGCYSSLPSSFTVVSTYGYETSSYCASQCSSYSYFALSKGGTCTCGSTAPSGATSDLCTIPCFGYDQETCGGDNVYDIYSNGGVVSGVTSGTTTTSTTSTQPTTSTGTTNAVTSTTTDTINASTTASAATSTKSQGGSTVVIYSTVSGETMVATSTMTISSSSSTSSSTSSASLSGSTTKKSASVIGPAVGGAVGGVVAIALGAFLFFFIRRRRLENKERDAELADSAYIGAMKRDDSQLGRPLSNPFLSKDELMVDQRLNPVMLGRRRISEGSLADEADYSRKILRVANPDD